MNGSRSACFMLPSPSLGGHVVPGGLISHTVSIKHSESNGVCDGWNELSLPAQCGPQLLNSLLAMVANSASVGV